MAKNTKLFEGRFAEGNSSIFSAFVDSIGFDIVLVPFDVQISKAHAKMLHETKLIDKDTRNEIINGLDQILGEYESG